MRIGNIDTSILKIFQWMESAKAKAAYGGDTYRCICKVFSQHHEQSSGADQHAADQAFGRELFMEKYKSKYQRDDHAQLINRHHL